MALTADGLTIAVGQQSSVYTFSRPDTAAGFPTSPSGSPTTPDGSHNFGASVAFGELDGTSLFVGDDQLSPGGGFHRFVRAGADFGVARETKLGLADLFGRQRYQHLGASLATFTDQDGGLLVAVGDPGFDTNITEGEPTTRHGGVRAFGLTEDGTWQRRPRFGSEGSPLSDDYGLSLSAIGYLTTVPHQVFAVGDRRDNGYAVRTVSYHRSDRGTEPLGELPENASADFASSVALSQDALLLVVGDQGTWDIGELTIWSRASRSVDFVYQRTIEAPAGAFSFGRSLALRRDGTELFVGAISPAGEGAVYQLFLE